MEDRTKTTIVALSTPRGYGGISIVRLSGQEALKILHKIFKSTTAISPRKAIFGEIFDSDGFIDTAITTYFKGPHSYTGEDVVEISIHGNPYLSDLTIEACINFGASPAAPGEFTRRAFLNNRMDLSQAEGVADLIYSSSRAAISASERLLTGTVGSEINVVRSDIIDVLSVLELELDFLEDEIGFTPKDDIVKQVNKIICDLKTLIKSYEIGKIIREGILCPIVGAPNSGKSSLFNAILKEERVIVSDVPGTTRDYVEEKIRVGKFQVSLVDTAGLRETLDNIEVLGIDKTKKLIEESDILLYVIDTSCPPKQILGLPLNTLRKTFFVLNKSDIASKKNIQQSIQVIGKNKYILCSALKNVGIQKILSALEKKYDGLLNKSDSVIITRLRHKDALVKTKYFLQKAINSIKRNNASEFVSVDLRGALIHLDTILGRTDNAEILNNIFNSFCIGK